MKNLIFKSSIILSLVLLTSFSVKESTFGIKKIIGVWEYSVPDAPYQYQQGVITFSKNKKEISGFLTIQGTKLNLENIVSKKNNITCDVYLEGETITFNLIFKKKLFSGKVHYSQGSLDITGTKKE